MPRPRSKTTIEAKNRLLMRLSDGSHRSGDRFFSNRAIARSFGISYQTAHRLLDELVAEGRLRRHPSSGTYVSGELNRLQGVELLFHPRSQRKDSFGHRLLEVMVRTLEKEGITPLLKSTIGATPDPRYYPIVWECPSALAALTQTEHYGLLLHEEPPPGLRASFVDSISIDDYSGGVAAAEWLSMRGSYDQIHILTGPVIDLRSQRRVDGFLSVVPHAKVTWASGWYLEDGIQAAGEAANADAVFCGNDRLAQALIHFCKKQKRNTPEIIGFDDAPVASEIGFSTIAIPWNEIAAEAARIAVRRIVGNPQPAARLVISPRPIAR